VLQLVLLPVVAFPLGTVFSISWEVRTCVHDQPRNWAEAEAVKIGSNNFFATATGSAGRSTKDEV